MKAILSSIRWYDYFVCRVNRFRVMTDFLRDSSACPVFCKTLPFSGLNRGHVWNVSDELYKITHKSFIIYLSFLNCDWLLIREVQWFYWTQELLVPVEKFTVRMPMERLELAIPGLQTQYSSHWAIQLKSYCWEGVEFIQLVYCIIIYLSFLNCDLLLIREVQWFYWTQELLVPVEKFTVRTPMVRLELATQLFPSNSFWAV